MYVGSLQGKFYVIVFGQNISASIVDDSYFEGVKKKKEKEKGWNRVGFDDVGYDSGFLIGFGAWFREQSVGFCLIPRPLI